MRNRRITVSIWRAWAVALVLVLLLAITAAAASNHRVFFRGPVGTGANNAGVEMNIKFSRHDRPLRVMRFGWFNVAVPPNCADSDEFPVTMRINDRHNFHGHASIPDTQRQATVRGHVKRSHRKVVGTLRLKGSFPGGCSGADTGKLHWVARLPAG